MRTDVGVVREHNEDSAHVDPGHNFFIVADGMGGHAAGEVASAMAVAKVRESLEQAREEISVFSDTPDEGRRKSLVKILENAVRTAHQSVYDRGTRESDKQGMGTTLDVVLVAGHEAFVAHVGDSRTYLIRQGKAAQITTDHTVAEVLVIEGKLTLEEAQISPLRTILVNAIGVAQDVGIEMAHVLLRQGDQLLLCSDGLHDYFPAEQELADHIHDNSPDGALMTLVELAKERGGHDNITGIVVHVVTCRPKHDALSSGEITQKLPTHEGVPGTLDRDDTLPVERVAVVDDAGDQRQRKKRKRGSKGRKVRAKKPTGEGSPVSGSNGGGQDDAGARKDGDQDLPGDLDDVATRTTEPMGVVEGPDDAANDDDANDAERDAGPGKPGNSQPSGSGAEDTPAGANGKTDGTNA